jgi:hypothetical protein
MTQQNFRQDSFVEGLAIKAPVKVATNAPITLSGEQTVNSVPLLVGDRVLVKDQADPAENGIYVVQTSAWTRAGDFDGSRDVVGGTLVPAYAVAGPGFIQYIVAGDGDAVVPTVDNINFTLFYDPNAGGGATLPISTNENNSLRADNAGGWEETDTVRITNAGEVFWNYESASQYGLLGPGTADGRRISTQGGSLELIADGGLAQVVIFGGSNLSIIDDGVIYMEETADHDTVLVGTGQFWVRSSDGAPMFTDSSSVDFQLNTSPTFSPPLVLLDDEQIEFGTGTDVIMEYDSTISGILVDPVTTSVPFAFNNGMELRFYNQIGSQYIGLENQGILGFNDLVMSASGGTSNFSYEVGAWDHNDNRFLRPVLDDYAIQHQTAGSVSNVLDIDFEDGNSAYVALTENVTTMTLSNPPASGRLGQLEIEILQDSVARTIAWPASVLWPGGTAPDLSTTNSRHLVHLRTRDGGTTYLGTYLENFS